MAELPEDFPQLFRKTLPQQEMLRYIMKIGRMKRKDLAEAMYVSVRTLAAWLLPDTSNGHRKMESIHQNTLMRLYYEVMRGDLCDATISDEVPVVHCEPKDFDFPTIYKVTVKYRMQTWPDLGFKENYGVEYTLNGSADDIDVRNEPYLQISIVSIEPVHARNMKDDANHWLFITEHLSVEQMDGYVDGVAIMTVRPDQEDSLFPIRRYRLDGRLFTLTRTAKPCGESVQDAVTVYTSNDYFEKVSRSHSPVTNVETSLWIKYYDKNGLEIDQDDAFVPKEKRNEN